MPGCHGLRVPRAEGAPCAAVLAQPAVPQGLSEFLCSPESTLRDDLGSAQGHNQLKETQLSE